MLRHSIPFLRPLKKKQLHDKIASSNGTFQILARLCRVRHIINLEASFVEHMQVAYRKKF